MASIFATQNIPGRCFPLITDAGHSLKLHNGENILSTLEIIEMMGSPDVLVCTLANEITSEVFDASPSIRMVANYAVGYNNIDIAAATERGIVVTNTPGALTEATADLAWALLTACARRVVEGDAICRGGKFKGWLPTLLLGREIYGTTIGILGAGRIGQAVARRAVGFGMRILYYNRTRKPEFEETTGAALVTPEQLFAESDYLSVHLPYTPQTNRFVSARLLDMAKPGMVLINTGRGTVVDEDALVKALKDSKIAGAGLDVFEQEPYITPALLKMKNVVLLPHIGSATTVTRSKMGEVVAVNVLAFLSGSTPPNPVNPSVLGL